MNLRGPILCAFPDWRAHRNLEPHAPHTAARGGVARAHLVKYAH